MQTKKQKKIKLYQTVKLISNNYENDGIPEGTIGTVIEVLGEGYMVDFGDEKKFPLFGHVFCRDEIELV